MDTPLFECELDRCVYCGMIATTRDHIIPYSFQYDTNRKKHKNWRKDYKNKNIVPCCKECNSLSSNHIFNSLEEKREYIHQRIRKRYSHILKLPKWTESEIDEMGKKFSSNIRLSLLSKEFIENRLNWPDKGYDDTANSQQIYKELKRYSI